MKQLNQEAEDLRKELKRNTVSGIHQWVWLNSPVTIDLPLCILMVAPYSQTCNSDHLLLVTTQTSPARNHIIYNLYSTTTSLTRPAIAFKCVGPVSLGGIHISPPPPPNFPMIPASPEILAQSQEGGGGGGGGHALLPACPKYVIILFQYRDRGKWDLTS